VSLVRRQTHLLRTVAALSFQSSLAYRFDALVAGVTSPLYLLAQSVVWREVFRVSRRATLGGFDYPAMLSYLAVSYLMNALTWDRVTETLKTEVREGSFIVHLLRPLSFLYFGFLAKIGDRSLALVLEVVPVTLVMGAFFGFAVFRCRNVPAFVAAVAIAFVISYLVALLLGMLAFWIVRPDGIIWIYLAFSRFFLGSWLPLSIFPGAVQKIFLLLPFQFVVFVPARLFTGDYELGGVALAPGTVLLYGLVQAALLFAVTLVLWRLSVRRFCGEGT
jgi:ABC-2 type transport system permease protein